MLLLFSFGPGTNAEGDQQAVDRRAVEQAERGGFVPSGDGFASVCRESLVLGASG
jgi:hypothetical protein